MVYILFDVPDNNNDKVWLYDELCQQFGKENITSIKIHHITSILINKGGIKRLYGFIVLFSQAFRTILKAKRSDTVICWSMYQSMFFGRLAFILRTKYHHVIFMNWLTPLISSRRLRIYKDIVKWLEPDIIVNSSDSITEWEEVLSIPSNKFHLIPDVYDTNIPFIKKTNQQDDKYCFTGGMSNRDWNMIVNIACYLPNIKFVCVALETDFKAQVITLPPNVKVYYNISPEKYYNLMKQAYIILLPLVDDRVSGLINIIRAAQYRIPCAVTQTTATKQYYSNETQFLLLDRAIDHWISAIHTIYLMSPTEYNTLVDNFQNYIKTEFSPLKAASQIARIIL